jgi:hypothetical protein
MPFAHALRLRHDRHMIALTDTQLKTLMSTAGMIDPAKRDLFLRRVAVMLKMRHRFNDGDVDEIVHSADSSITARHDRQTLKNKINWCSPFTRVCYAHMSDA